MNLKSAFHWLTLHNCITMHGTKNLKLLGLSFSWRMRWDGQGL